MKIATYCIALLLLISFAAAYENCGDGVIAISKTPCGEMPTTNDTFEVGDTVYVHGWGFERNCSISWQFDSDYGHARQAKSVGILSTNYGYFCVPVMNITEQDKRAGIGNFEFVIDHNGGGGSQSFVQSIPEFTTIGATIALIGAMSIYYIRRRNDTKGNQ